MKRSHAYDPVAGFLKKGVRFPKKLSNRKAWSELFELKRGEYPHLHQIEPTNHCPYSCIMCPRKDMKRMVGFMELALFQKVIDEYATYPEPVRSMDIELFHFGESLLHPQCEQMIHYAAEHKLNMILSVNAPVMQPDRAEKILKAKPRLIYVSMDGYDEKSYQKIRGTAIVFKAAVQNIEALIEIHRGLKSETIIVLRMIQLAENSDHAREFKKLWENKGIHVELRQFFPWTDKKMKDLGSYQKFPPGMPCPFPWQYLVVQYSGDVVPCCRDYDGLNVLGNVREQTLREIWNSSAYEWFRKQHSSGEFGKNTFCKECTEIYYTDPSQTTITGEFEE